MQLSDSAHVHAEAEAEAVEIITVCTGNICRSPFAEIVLRDRLAGLPVVVASAGTHAVVGAPLPAAMAIGASTRGLDATHAARQVTADMLRTPDLVLGLARDHRRAVATLAPRSGRKALTLLELARIVEHRGPELAREAHAAAPDVVGRLRAAIGFALAERGTVRPPEHPADLDVADPFGRDDKAYARAVEQIVRAVDLVSDHLHHAAGHR